MYYDLDVKIPSIDFGVKGTTKSCPSPQSTARQDLRFALMTATTDPWL
jgi:hypothetical protein